MKHIHRSAALLLALCLLAGLTACGKRPPEKTAQTDRKSTRLNSSHP